MVSYTLLANFQQLCAQLVIPMNLGWLPTFFWGGASFASEFYLITSFSLSICVYPSLPSHSSFHVTFKVFLIMPSQPPLLLSFALNSWSHILWFLHIEHLLPACHPTLICKLQSLPSTFRFSGIGFDVIPHIFFLFSQSNILSSSIPLIEDFLLHILLFSCIF